MPIPETKLLYVLLLQTDVSDTNLPTKNVADFTMAYPIDDFFKIVLKVNNDNIKLNGGCNASHVVKVVKGSVKLAFDSSSILYIGQGGPLLTDTFNVSVLFLLSVYYFLYTSLYAATSTCVSL